MEQMPNSEQNAQITSVCPTCHNTMLGAGAVSGDDVSNEKNKIAKINIVIGGFDLSVEIKEIVEKETICPAIINLKENQYSKI